MEDGLTPDGDERSPLEEHFVWLSKDYLPYNNKLGPPFVPPDFTLGLPPVIKLASSGQGAPLDLRSGGPSQTNLHSPGRVHWHQFHG